MFELKCALLYICLVYRCVTEKGRGINICIFRFKTGSVSNGSAVCFCRPEVAITPGGKSN